MRKFAVGATLLYVGAVSFLVGSMLSGIPNSLFDGITKSLIPLNWDASTRAAVFQILGSLIAVTGFVLCIWPVKPAPPPRPPSPTVIIQKITEPAAPAPAQAATVSVAKCKYCGSEMQAGALFCPSCQRAQA